MSAIFKDPEFRCVALTRTARDQACQNCGSSQGVVWAHSNQGEHGKGKSRKAHDCFGAWLCQRCHTWLDQGSIGTDPTGLYIPCRNDKQAMWQRAANRTLLELWRQGLVRAVK